MHRASLLRLQSRAAKSVVIVPVQATGVTVTPHLLHSKRRDYSSRNRISWRFADEHASQQQSAWFFPNRIHQIRWSSKKRQKQLQMSADDDPFAVLRVSRKQSYTAVKSAFLRIAMKHHPDTAAAAGAGTPAEREASKEIFVAARTAFEALVAGPGGLAILRAEAAGNVAEEDDLDTWFKSETGYDMPFMDAATMKEVAEMTESVGGGLDRDGGMWTLARMVADTVKSGGDGRSILQLESGTVRDRNIDGVLRRRKRR